jgi:hypothetical protein
VNRKYDRHTADFVTFQQAYPGLAWATSRSFLQSIGGIYDRVITGGGDNAWVMSVYGDYPQHRTSVWSNALTAGVKRYGGRVSPLVESVGYVPSRGIHLYHGKLTSRQYRRRNDILGQINFDPDRHLEYAPNGTLRWSSEAPPKLKRAVRDYMHGRKEDE